MKKITLAILMVTAPLVSISSVFASSSPLKNDDYIQVNPEYNISVSSAKREVALEFSRQYYRALPALQSSINQYNLAVDASSVLQSSGISTQVLRRNELAIRDAKGLSTEADNSVVSRGIDKANLLQFRLADASMFVDWQQGESPLFAFEPDGDDQDWTNIEAYDVDGNIHLLDVYELPQKPVFIIGLDKQQAMREGIEVMRSILSNNIDSAKSLNISRQMATSITEQPISTTVIKQIKLNNDHEPWISGAAEIYAIVTGVNPSRDEPVLDIIEMPYLDYAGNEYYPNQVIIHWERYRWAAADMLLMEHDDGTNYKKLASVLLTSAETILRSFPNPDVQGYALIATITNGILQAMPDAWFTNDDDYVDVYYTLQEGETYTNHHGAGGNARATFSPLVIQPR